MRPALYHFTARHLATRIDRAGGVLLPHPAPWEAIDQQLRQHRLPVTGLAGAPRIVWLTDAAEPHSDAIGLTRVTLPYDRMAIRYTVEPAFLRAATASQLMPWADFCARYEPNPAWRAHLEQFAEPRRWWVAAARVPTCSSVDYQHYLKCRALRDGVVGRAS